MPRAPRRELVVVPRMGGTPESDWYPWLVDELEASYEQPFERIDVLAMPDPDAVPLEPWVETVRERLDVSSERLARTYVVTHSLGAHALMHALTHLPKGAGIAGAVCVAGWFEVNVGWPALLPWLKSPPDTARARLACARWGVALSDDDSYTPNHEANRARWEREVGAHVWMEEHVGHYNGQWEPMALEVLLAVAEGPWPPIQTGKNH